MPGFPRISIDLLFSAALAATIGFGAQAFIPAQPWRKIAPAIRMRWEPAAFLLSIPPRFTTSA